MSDEQNEIQRAVKIIDRMTSGLGFLPMHWDEAFNPELVAEIKAFMAEHSPDSLWREEEEDV